MFKKLTTIVAAAMMTLSASSAFAAFANYDLVRVISDTTSTREIATNLGNITTLSGLTNATVGGGADAFTSFTGGSSLNNLYVTYFAVNRVNAVNGTVYIASNNVTAPTSSTNGAILNALAANSTVTLPVSVLQYYNTLSATGNTVTAVNTNAAALARWGVANVGTYGGFTNVWAANANVNLGSLASAPLTMTLWQFGPGITSLNPLNGSEVLTLTLNADGSTTVNAVATPVPAAAWLLGSGLMGLVGLRRRKSA